MDVIATQSVKNATLEATVLRACRCMGFDKPGACGHPPKAEPLGLVASYHRNPVVRAWRWLRNPRLRGGHGHFGTLPGEGGLRVLTRTALDRFLFRLKGLRAPRGEVS